MTTSVIPVIAIQEVYSGGSFDGSVSDGTPSEEELFRGRIQKWTGGLVGGEFAAPDVVGMRVEQIHWGLVCAALPNVSIHLVDDDDAEYQISTANVASGSYVQTNGGILVPPSFKIRVKSDQVIDAVLPIVAEDTGVTGDGVTSKYDLTLVNGLVDPTSVSIVAGTVTFTDAAGDGVLTGAGGGGGSGTINYTTGVAEIIVTTPADFNAVNALATYDYNRIGRVAIVMNMGWGQPLPSKIGSIGNENRPPTMQRS